MSLHPIKFSLALFCVLTFTACTTTPDYMAQVQVPEQEQQQEQEKSSTETKADSGVPNWLWWVLGALAVGALAGAGSSEECIAVFDSDGRLIPGGCDQ